MLILGMVLTALIEGTVVGPGGKPLANALVLGRPASGAEREPAEAVRTDASGRFRLSVERSGGHDLRVESPGLVPATVSGVRPGAPVRIAMRKGRTLEGLVRDARTGDLVAGARVEAREEGGDRFSSLWQPKAGAIETRSDAKGRYRLEGLGDGLYTVTGRSRERGRALRQAVVAGSHLDLLLVSGGALSGLVTGPDRKPVAGAIVRLEPEAVRIGRRERPLPGEVTDSGGRFEMSGLEPGVYSLVAMHKDFAPAVAPGLSVTLDTAAQTQVALEPGAAVSGRLVAAKDRPVSGRVALQELDDEPAPAAVTESSKTTISRDGRFRLARLPRGSHGLTVKAEGYATRRIEVSVGRQDVDLGDIAMEVGLTIRGLVRDDAGLPVNGAQVSAFQWGTAEGLVRAESQADGAFVLPGLSPGRYHLRASATGYAGGAQEAAAGADEVAFALQPAGEVTGAVVDSEGRVVEAFAVAARPASRHVGPRDFQVVADSGGRFRVAGLAAATYILDVTAPGRGSAMMADVKVESGRTTDLGRLRLRPTTAVRGMVTDGVGSPIGGAVVSAHAPGMVRFGAPVGDVVTDATGAFELTGVSTGLVEVNARHPDYAEGTARVTLAEEERAPLRITLGRGGRLEGLVRTVAGLPPPMSFIRLETLGRVGVTVPTPDMVSTLRDGSFAFDHVPAGRSRLVLMTGKEGRFTRSETKEVEVREGATTTVQLVTP